MVLQMAPLKARLWGNVTAGTTVKVYVNGVIAHDGHATAVADGSWSIDLNPRGASPSNKVEIVPSSGSNITLTNVAFGDVYLCSGQSNMQFSVRDAFNASAEIAASSNYPNLRLATVAMTTSNAPQDDVPSKPDSKSRPVWAPSSPAAINPSIAFSWPSAVCYFFGRSLYIEKGGNIPIGLIGSDWGGQRVEAFSSPDALNDTTCGGTQPHDDANAYNHSQNDGTGMVPRYGLSTEDPPWQDPVPGPTQLWYGMIYPLINMRFKGAVWYQGTVYSVSTVLQCIPLLRYSMVPRRG
jgi:sialate O-acetylesterase